MEAADLLLALLMLCVATLYASVGHGGASGYIAVMALLGLAPDTIRPVALGLNVIVAGVATAQFAGAGHFRGRLLWPFVLPAIPCAALAGSHPIGDTGFSVITGVVLLLSSARLFWDPGDASPTRAVSIRVAVPVGAVLGLLSGWIGVGGGIFLTPLLLFSGWATVRAAAAVSAPFVLLNSLAGLAGWSLSGSPWPSLWLFVPLAMVVLLGGIVGSWLGSRRLSPLGVRRALALVLLVAGVKLLSGSGLFSMPGAT